MRDSFLFLFYPIKTKRIIKVLRFCFGLFELIHLFLIEFMRIPLTHKLEFKYTWSSSVLRISIFFSNSSLNALETLDFCSPKSFATLD